MCLYGLLCYSSALVLLFLLILHKVRFGMALKTWSKCMWAQLTVCLIECLPSAIFKSLLWRNREGRETELSLQSGIASSFFGQLEKFIPIKKKKKKDNFLAQCYSRAWMFLKAALGVPVGHLKYWITFTTFGDCVWCLIICFTYKPEIDVEGVFFFWFSNIYKKHVFYIFSLLI